MRTPGLDSPKFSAVPLPSLAASHAPVMLPNIRAYLTCPSSGSLPLSPSLSPPNAWHPMFSLVWDPMLCHLGCSHPRTLLPLFKQIESVFCHFHMLYGVEHMVVAHLTHLLNAMVPKRGEVSVLTFCSFLPLLPSLPASMQTR